MGTETDAGVSVDYAGQTFTCGHSVSELGKLARDLIAAGVAPGSMLIVSGFYYTIEDLRKCARAVHFRLIDLYGS